MPPLLRTDEPRILIARLSAIGDCIQTMPLAAALRERFPRAKITWVVEPMAASLVRIFAAVDEVLVVPKRFAHSLTKLWQLRRELRRGRFDLSLDPQGLSKSGLVVWLSGAPLRIGLARPAGREVNPWFQTHLVTSRAVHMVDRYLELLQPLGVEPNRPRFDLRIPAEATQAAERLAALPQFAGRFAVLNPGAGWPSKLWPLDRFAAVARHLADRGLGSVVVWGSDRERAWAESIVSAAKSPNVLVAPPTSLPELTAVLKAARLFIGSDTGPLHLAAAVGTPSIGLFGSSLGSAAGPYGFGQITLQSAFDNSPTRKRRGADNWAMRRIGVEMVTRACDEQLQRPAKDAA